VGYNLSFRDFNIDQPGSNGSIGRSCYCHFQE